VKAHRTNQGISQGTRQGINQGVDTNRRGVAAVLAMMFLVLFGSLSAAMAVVSQGNLRTASSHLLVTRALGAVDTGLDIARARLARAATQFRVERGEVDASYADDLWNGTWSAADGDVLNPQGDDATSGIAGILTDTHMLDETVALPVDYAVGGDWLVTNPIVLSRNDNGDPIEATQITYIPLGSGDFRAVVTGFAFDGVDGTWLTRTARQDFLVLKRVKHAILGPSKIMIGKNVQINGPIGARYDQVEQVDGHPIQVTSDFYGLDPTLDQIIEDFYESVIANDTNGDSRLSINHTIEGAGLSALNANDYSGDGSPDNAFTEVSSAADGVIDEFDLFMTFYDANQDGKVVLGGVLSAGTPNELLAPEFSAVDDDLAFLIDAALPDRNGDGFVDARDTALGYRDGAIDMKDRYAKIRGSVYVRANRGDWESQLDGDGNPLDDYQEILQGVIRSGAGDPPIGFDQGDDVLPDVGFDTFDSAQTALAAAANGGPFLTQAGIDHLWTLETGADGEVTGVALNPVFDADAGADADYGVIVERAPYGAPAAADWYERPVIRNRVFKDVRIPVGTNALFEDCVFAGVTFVETHTANGHPAWRYYGLQNPDLSLKHPPLPDFSDAQLDNEYYNEVIIKPPSFDVPRLEVAGTNYVNTKPLSNNIRFHDCVFVGSVVADKPEVYNPIRNKLVFTGSTKFYDQHPDNPGDPDLNPDEADEALIAQSSMMVPHYSVDIGTNNADPAQDVNLNGLIIAGVLDVRGNTTLNGALLLTFDPRTTDPALQHFGDAVANPANFNVTLGYFNPDQGDVEGYTVFENDGQQIVGFDLDGDGLPDTTNPGDGGTPVPFNGFGKIVFNYDPNIVMPDGLIAPIDIDPISYTYREGRLSQTAAAP